MLRPFATPLPLGFLGLFVATASFAALQLSWVPAEQGQPLALAALLLTAPVQLVAVVLGFLACDPVAGTGAGVLVGTWAADGRAAARGCQPVRRPGLRARGRTGAGCAAHRPQGP
ncbi:hypothetical protein DT076_05255 [Desertihabitans brevis]|uniref:Uncharacterized protein n=1 Tax=Desertihabitans brevis TaxID=2268447 RepID=A0A367YZ68_9ACTN|nr:hypothetical protein DT076_05255 [Desertihabitans brevis]